MSTTLLASLVEKMFFFKMLALEKNGTSRAKQQINFDFNVFLHPTLIKAVPHPNNTKVLKVTKRIGDTGL